MNIQQCRMARAGLNWSAADLAQHSGVGYATVARFESGKPVRPESVAAMRTAFEAQGAQLIDGGALVGAMAPVEPTG
jgi:transcriptional regulator with XRE-family HTH domain